MGGFLPGAAALAASLAALLIWPSAAAEGVRRGLSLAAESIIPSLFPFFVLSALAGELGVPQRLARRLSAPMGRLFGLLGTGAAALLAGVLGGYPLGAAATSGLVERGQLAPQEHKYSIYLEPSQVGDFKFCLIRKTLSPETEISGINRRCMELKYFIRSLCGSPARWYGLENSSLIYEYVPLFSRTKRQHKLSRVELPESERVVPKPSPAEVESREEEEDIFSIRMREDRERSVEEATAVVGGDTASFRPLLDDEEDEDEATE